MERPIDVGLFQKPGCITPNILSVKAEDINETLGVSQVARRLRVNPETVRVWFRRKVLPGKRRGSRWTMRVEDFNRILNNDNK